MTFKETHDPNECGMAPEKFFPSITTPHMKKPQMTIYISLAEQSSIVFHVLTFKKMVRDLS